jgi:glycerol-3-phosphate acyltransferase PlsY
LIINIILISIIFYLIGSIPNAYLLTRSRNIDITKAGSGNVGALNSYEVTKSKTIGILVLLFDLLKGFLPAFILTGLFEVPLNLALLPLIMLIAGHNFSIWLKFKGGRGLATAAGICIAVNFWLLIFWAALFLICFAIKRNVHIGNVVATVLLPLTIIFTSDFLIKFNYDYSNSPELINYHSAALFTLIASISILILIKHIKPVVELIKKSKNKN